MIVSYSETFFKLLEEKLQKYSLMFKPQQIFFLTIYDRNLVRRIFFQRNTAWAFVIEDYYSRYSYGGVNEANFMKIQRIIRCEFLIHLENLLLESSSDGIIVDKEVNGVGILERIQ